MTANSPFPTLFSAAQRPHEALVAQAAEASIRQVNRFVGCVKPALPAFNPLNPQSALDPGYLGGLLTTDPRLRGESRPRALGHVRR